MMINLNFEMSKFLRLQINVRVGFTNLHLGAG